MIVRTRLRSTSSSFGHSTVIFAFTALEAYSNECIPDPFTWTTRRRKGGVEEEVTYDREGVERYVVLAEKLDAILPGVFTVKSVKGRAPWENFQKLRALRDRLIHLKMSTRR